MPIKKMKKVQALFKQKCITYLLLRKFSWIVKDFNGEILIILNKELKQYYNRTMFSSFFRGNETFEIFIIYLIKITTQFLAKHFNNLLIDSTLESEMCIILYYTFLGVEITEKVYEIMHKKYLSKVEKKEDLRQTSHKQSFFTPKRQSSRLQYSRHSIIKFTKKLEPREALTDFSSQLKENLHVDPLPPLKRQKINIRQLQRIHTEAGEKENKEIKIKEEGANSLYCKKKHLFSNQLSNSFKMLHPDNLLFQLNSKKVKFNQSFYDYRQENSFHLDRLETSQERSKEKDAQFQSTYFKAKSQKGNQDWQSIIQELKKKMMIKKTTKCQKTQSQLKVLEEQSSLVPSETNIKQVEVKAKTTPIQPVLGNVEKQVVEKDYGSIEGFKREDSRELSGFFSIKTFLDGGEPVSNFYTKKSQKLKKESIREEKGQFFNSCSLRKSQLLDAKKINLHAQWIINHYKE